MMNIHDPTTEYEHTFLSQESPYPEHDIIDQYIKKDLLEMLTDGTLKIEELKAATKEAVELKKRKEILKKYKIGYIEKEDRYYVVFDGKQIRKRNRKKLEDEIVRRYRETYESVDSLKSLWDDVYARAKEETTSRTWSKYKRYYERFIIGSGIENVAISKLSLSDGYEFFEHCRIVTGGMTKKYWYNILSLIHKFFELAMERELIERNPWENLKPNRQRFKPLEQKREEDEVFSDMEIKKVCSLAREDAANKRSGIPLGIILLFNSGMRIGELTALRWCDIDDKYIYINRITVPSYDDEGRHIGFEDIDFTKTVSGIRKIHLTSEGSVVLKKIKQYNEESGYPTGDMDKIFWRTYHGVSSPCNHRSFDARLRRYCKIGHLSVPKSAHDTRRTALTLLYEAGLPLSHIQKIAGHKTIAQTMAYLRLREDNIDDRAYMEKLRTSTAPTDKIVPFVNKKAL